MLESAPSALPSPSESLTETRSRRYFGSVIIAIPVRDVSHGDAGVWCVHTVE